MTHEFEDGLHMVPLHMREGVTAHFRQGRPVGSFLSALLANDLMTAVGHADIQNLQALQQWCQFLYGFAPPGSYGSRKNFLDWQRRGGLDGGANIPEPVGEREDDDDRVR